MNTFRRSIASFASDGSAADEFAKLRPVKPPAGRRSAPAWRWIVAVAAAVAVIQMAQGTFVKSVSVPGGGKITFSPSRSANGSSTNRLDQLGQDNLAVIKGSHNTVRQEGRGNCATIGDVSNCKR
jgi:hypothetical protein